MYPGMIRVDAEDSGAAKIAVEVWRTRLGVSADSRREPPGLAIGKLNSRTDASFWCSRRTVDRQRWRKSHHMAAGAATWTKGELSDSRLAPHISVLNGSREAEIDTTV